MKTTRTKICVLLASAAAAFSCASAASAHPNEDPAPPTMPSWEEFKEQAYQDADGRYIVDGDVPLQDEAELREFYDSLGSEDSKGDLVVNTDGLGNRTLWSAQEAQNLTYCVSDDFGHRKQDVVDAMADGAAIWENATGGIDFIYVPEEDGSCTTQNDSIVFSVEPSASTQYIARAFFPDTPKSGRNILVTPQLTSSGWSPASIMAHEQGHVLGFRHEHTRPEAGTCFEDNNWDPLTPYDSSSIMHYPQCNGSSEDLSFSAMDAEGVREVY